MPISSSSSAQHVAASLALFASVALLFWYILQLFLPRRN
jgi:FtsH-binding integral membrane protein